jgi:hypothetical protein
VEALGMRDGYTVLPGWLSDVAAACAAAGAVAAVPACTRENNTLLPLRWSDELVGLLLAHTGALDWHQDWWCWDHPASYEPATAQVALLVYLSDTDEATGALRVQPGSHHGRASEPVTLSLGAGDAVVLDYRLLHAPLLPWHDGPRRDLPLNRTPAWEVTA